MQNAGCKLQNARTDERQHLASSIRYPASGIWHLASVIGHWSLVIAVASVVVVGVAVAFEQAALFVTSVPSDATVILDGRSVGKTPLTLTGIAEGDHTLDIRKDGYESASRQIRAVAGELSSMGFTLTPVQGSLQLFTDLVGAQILLDGQVVGTVSADRTEYAQDKLSAGQHVLVLRSDNVEITRQFSVSAPPQPVVITVRRQEVTGSVEIASDIPVSAVFFDGKPVAQDLPALLDPVAAGQHQVVLRTDTVPVFRQVVVSPGQRAQVSLREEETGALIVASDPAGLQVWVDGVPLAAATPTTLSGIPVGDHRVEVLSPSEGLQYGSKTVGIEAGKPALVTFAGAEVATSIARCPPDMVFIPAGPVSGKSLAPVAPSAGGPAVAPGMGGPMMGPGMAAPPMGGIAGRPPMVPGVGLEGGPMGAPGGAMGAAAAGPQVIAPGSRRILTGFCIDKYEFPNRPGAVPELANFYEAAQKCREQGKRLCFAQEWVRACAGPGDLDFPYGDDYDPNKCNILGNPASHGLAPSGSFPACVSGYGVYDMSGNAEEWVYTASEPMAPPDLPSGEGWLALNTRDYGNLDRPPAVQPGSPPDLRGGSWLSGRWDSSCQESGLFADYRKRSWSLSIGQVEGPTAEAAIKEQVTTTYSFPGGAGMAVQTAIQRGLTRKRGFRCCLDQ